MAYFLYVLLQIKAATPLDCKQQSFGTQKQNEIKLPFFFKTFFSEETNKCLVYFKKSINVQIVKFKHRRFITS